jgi:hypothetical protein
LKGEEGDGEKDKQHVLKQDQQHNSFQVKTKNPSDSLICIRNPTGLDNRSGKRSAIRNEQQSGRYIVLLWRGDNTANFIGHKAVRKERRTAFPLLKWTIHNIPAGGIFEQFLYGIDADTMGVNHLPQTLNPLNIPHRIVPPGAFTKRAYQAFVLIAAQSTGMDIEHLRNHPYREYCFFI